MTLTTLRNFPACLLLATLSTACGPAYIDCTKEVSNPVCDTRYMTRLISIENQAPESMVVVEHEVSSYRIGQSPETTVISQRMQTGTTAEAALRLRKDLTTNHHGLLYVYVTTAGQTLEFQYYYDEFSAMFTGGNICLTYEYDKVYADYVLVLETECSQGIHNSAPVVTPEPHQ